MKLLNKKSIKEINQEKQQEAGRDKVAQSLAAELATTKLKLMQAENVNKNLSAEVVNIKLDLMKIKGGNA